MRASVGQKAVVAVVLGLLCLWDIYHITFGKVFDISAFIIATIYLVLHQRVLFDHKAILLWLPFLAVGWFSDPLAQIGIMFGLLFYTFFYSSKVNLDEYIFILIRLFFALQLVDAVAYFAYGRTLSFYPDVFLDKRNYDGSYFFRPTGIFAEANALSMTMLVLLGMLSDTFKNYKKASIIVIFSMALSFSLFGMLAAATLFLLTVFSRAGFLSAIVISLIAVFLLTKGIVTFTYTDIFLNRLMNIGDDSSAVARLGLTNEYGLDVLIPQGFTTQNIEGNYYAANMLLSMLFATGLFFPIFLYTYYRGASGLRGYIIYSLILLSHPFYTYGIFWAFIAINARRKDL